jgi:hypothetical protein
VSANCGHRLPVSLRWAGIDPAMQMLGPCGAGRGTLPQDASQSVEHQVTRVEGILPSRPTPDLPLVAADGVRERPLPSLAEQQLASLRCSHAKPSENARIADTPHGSGPGPISAARLSGSATSGSLRSGEP